MISLLGSRLKHFCPSNTTLCFGNLFRSNKTSAVAYTTKWTLVSFVVSFVGTNQKKKKYARYIFSPVLTPIKICVRRAITAPLTLRDVTTAYPICVFSPTVRP